MAVSKIGTGGDYTSFDAFEATLSGTLATDTEAAFFNELFTIGVNIAGFTTGSSAKLILRAATAAETGSVSAKHDGTAGSGARLFRAENTLGVVYFSDTNVKHVLVKDLEIYSDNTATCRGVYPNHTSYSDVVVENCIMHDFNNHGVDFSKAPTGITARARNVAIWNINQSGANSAVMGNSADATRATCEYVTAVSDATDDNRLGAGFRYVIAKNCASFYFGGSSSYTDFKDLGSGSSNNASSDASGNVTSLVASNQFVSATSPWDLHLKSGSALEGAGASIGGITTDFEGDTRDGSTPDIGFDEFSSGGVTTSGTGSASGVGAASGVGRSRATSAGASAGTSTATAVGSPIASAVGAASGIGTATGVSVSTAVAVGTAAGSGTASATGSSVAVGAGAASATGTATGVSTGSNVGSAFGVGSALGVGSSRAVGSGAATAIGTATGVGVSTAAATGTAQGIGAGAGVGASTASAAGSASGVGVAVAFSAAGASVGVAAGVGSALGVGSSKAVAAGSSSANGSASAVGLAVFRGTGSAAGVGSALAIGASKAVAAGSASGVGTASAFTGGISTGNAAGIGTATAGGSSTALATGTASGGGTAAAAFGSSTASATGSSASVGTAVGSGASKAVSYGFASCVGTATAGAGYAVTLARVANRGRRFVVRARRRISAPAHRRMQ